MREERGSSTCELSWKRNYFKSWQKTDFRQQLQFMQQFPSSEIRQIFERATAGEVSGDLTNDWLKIEFKEGLLHAILF